MRDLLVHHATLLRRPAPTSEYGTPVDAGFVVVDTFDCRLSWSGGFEIPDSRSDQRGQTRTGTIFAMYEDVSVGRGDRITVTEFTGPTFEVEFNRVIWDDATPHHWEIEVRQVVGA